MDNLTKTTAELDAEFKLREDEALKLLRQQLARGGAFEDLLFEILGTVLVNRSLGLLVGSSLEATAAFDDLVEQWYRRWRALAKKESGHVAKSEIVDDGAATAVRGGVRDAGHGGHGGGVRGPGDDADRR